MLWFNKKKTLSSTATYTPQDVAAYYDEWTPRYTALGGELIEAFRAANDIDTVQYYLEAAHLADGQRILDAGCGVAGPAAYFAEQLNVQVDALTISAVQVETARRNIAKKTLRGKVNVHQGDYHQLGQYFTANTYDRIVFLESLGHANRPEVVIAESAKLLKTGAYIYIKDFFLKESNDNAFLERCAKVVENINRYYTYNTLDLHKTLSALRQNNLEIMVLRKPAFQDDIAVRLAFESQNGINIFGDLAPFVPTDWYEILAKKIEA